MKENLILPLYTLLLSGALADAAPLLDFANGPGVKIKLSTSAGGVPSTIEISDSDGSHTMDFRADAGFWWLTRDRGASLSPSGTFYCYEVFEFSDRNLKQDIDPVDCRKILDQLLSLPIHTWSFTNSSGVRNIGPMAQDFYATFKFGADDKHIAARNTAGVALAAIQGLHQMVQEQRLELHKKEARIAELEKQTVKMGSLEGRIKRLEQLQKESNSPSEGASTKDSQPKLGQPRESLPSQQDDGVEAVGAGMLLPPVTFPRPS